MISIGLDLSISSTGVCIYDTIHHTSIYYILCHKMTKKAASYLLEDHADIPDITPILYVKKNVDKNDEYFNKEYVKTRTVYDIVEALRVIIKKHHPDLATIEGVSLGSRGSVIDLAGLNYAVRMMLLQEGVEHIYIVSPTQNKKFATANGSAEKDLMISAWYKCEPSAKMIPDFIKVDDIADAYFLSRYGDHIFNIYSNVY